MGTSGRGNPGQGCVAPRHAPPAVPYGDGMGVAVAGPTRTGPYFAGPTEPTLTAEALARVGLSAQPFAARTAKVVRTSPKGKWHVPGDGPDRCQQLTRAYGYRASATSLPVHFWVASLQQTWRRVASQGFPSRSQEARLYITRRLAGQDQPQF